MKSALQSPATFIQNELVKVFEIMQKSLLLKLRSGEVLNAGDTILLDGEPLYLVVRVDVEMCIETVQNFLPL